MAARRLFPLLTSGAGQDGLGYYVTTDSNGDFTITGDYTCPTAYSETYVYAVGGNPGSGANSAATLLSGGRWMQQFRLRGRKRSIDHRVGLRLRWIRRL